MRTNIFSLVLVFNICLFYLGVDPYLLSILLFGLIIYRIIDKIGKGIVLLELAMFFSVLTYLIMPILGFEVYNKSSAIAVTWAKIMPIERDTYFNFFYPAISTFFLGLVFHFNKKEAIDEGINMLGILSKMKILLKDSLRNGIILSSIGMVFYILNQTINLGYVGALFYFLLYPGMMYIYFTQNSKIKFFFLGLDILFILYNAYITGMFTIIVYMGATLFSIALIGTYIKFWKKFVIFLLGFSFIVVVQSVKGVVRQSKGLSNKFNLTGERGIAGAFTEEGFFPLYTRFNQGELSARVLKRIPYYQEFDDGKSLTNTVLSAFVPRFFWPDKPQSGGYYNMKHFAGFELKGYTMNIGPPGEAYGNFGVTGGIIFMFFFGLFIRFFYIQTIKIADKIPLLILWLPISFYQVLYCMENDTLQAVNSLTKGSFFIYLIFRIYPNIFSIKPKSFND